MILLANRGDIACRIIRTAKRFGIRTVSVYSDADKYNLHVKSADEAVRIGPPPACLSYLNDSSIIEAAARTGSQEFYTGAYIGGRLTEMHKLADKLLFESFLS
ncbi:unnamed protein product [Cuscuta epithymum]|uniref:Biotin carboxylation domain-containing protein n=1 Tax=Cuscuta epithymum TaxID=186058 RepID=A0AAV0EWG5_9ASTE|nr:unnamed protein product [Cuscuta epithymum]